MSQTAARNLQMLETDKGLCTNTGLTKNFNLKNSAT